MKASLLVLAALAMLAFAPSIASASPSPSAPSIPSAPPADPPSFGPPSMASPAGSPTVPAREPVRGERSPLIARSLTVGIPLLGLAIGVPIADREPDIGGGSMLVAASVIVGPSTGWFYAGRPWHGLATMAGRLTGGVLIARGVLGSWEATPTRSEESQVLGGVALVIGATLVDLIGPPSVIARDNLRVRTVVVPAAHPGGGGLALTGSF